MSLSSTPTFSSFTTLLTTLLILSAALPPSSSSVPTTKNPNPFKKIYAFGDSYTDTGNTNSATGPIFFTFVSNPPYGRTFFHHPTNRYSDGRLVIDFVAEFLSLPYLPPYLDKRADRSKGVNFAVAGGTAIPHRFFVRNNLTLNITPQSIQTQLKWFNRFLETQGCRSETTSSSSSECKAVFDDTLFWIGEVGSNDYGYSLGSSVTSDTIRHLGIKSVTSFLQALLTKGAKYVVVQGLLTSGCLPLSMLLGSGDQRDAIGCVAAENNLTYTHNLVLQSKLQDLRKQFPAAVIVYADYWNAFYTVVKSPKKYGFTEPYKACCGSGGGDLNFDPFGMCGSPAATSCENPSEYINWDGAHLTEAMYRAVSQMFINGTLCHPPFDYMLSRKLQSG